jgi:insertion element IS1 protein InsB
LQPKSRRTDPKTIEAIERALEERMPMNAIKRTFKVGWDTIEKIAKKLASCTLSFFAVPKDSVEMDELCVSKKQNLWIYTAVSRYSGQILGYLLSDHTWENVKTLGKMLPKEWRSRLIYTDGYGGYAEHFPSSQHRGCVKFDGGTCTVEGVNNSLRHRCGALVRRSSVRRASARSVALASLARRVAFAVMSHNRVAKKRYEKKTSKTTPSGE